MTKIEAKAILRRRMMRCIRPRMAALRLGSELGIEGNPALSDGEIWKWIQGVIAENCS